ncbi:hypothetical protein ACFVJI_31860 [Streptomyces sp. NPDC127584]|uniref:hypothetical protein n=1 Tax=Streptomyces sp. NPDC127584 TaxID=3345403 RepID=UPI0036435762
MALWSLPRASVRKRVLVMGAAAGAAGAILGPVQAAQADIIGIGNSHNGNTAVTHGSNQSTNVTTTGSGILTGPGAVLPTNITQANAGNSGISCEEGGVQQRADVGVTRGNANFAAAADS